MLALTLLPVLLAHTPHDATVYVDVFGEDPPQVLTGFGRARVWYGLRSWDGGWTWDAQLVEPWADGVLDGAWLDGERVALATDGQGLQISEDGVSWSAAVGIPGGARLSAVRVVSRDPGLALAAGEGLYRSEDGGISWAEVEIPVEGAVLDLAWSPTRPEWICLLAAPAQIACSSDGGESWSPRLSMPVAGLDLAASQDGILLLAAGESGLFAAGPEEAEMTLVPTGRSWVGAVEVTAGGIVFIAEEETLWRSTDGGASFAQVVEGLEVPGEGRGGPPEPGHYYRMVESGDGWLYLASWEGVHRSSDGGETWQQMPIVQPAIHFQLQILPGADIAMSSYGGGGLSLIEGGEIRLLSASSPATFLRESLLSEDFQGDGIGWMGEKGNLWVTEDGGASWEDLSQSGALDYVETFALSSGTDAPPVALAAGFYGESLDLALSEDGGQSWRRPGLSQSLDPKYILDVTFSPAWESDGRVYASLEGPVLLISEGGGPFSVLEYPPVELLQLVFSDPETLWAATADGIWRRAPEGGMEQVALAGRLVTDIAFSPDFAEDGVAWAALPEGLVSTRDGGESWQEAASSPPGAALDIEISPEFQEDGFIAAAGWEGVWRSRDGGESWELASNLLWIDEGHPQWALGDDWRLSGEISGALARTAADARIEGATATLSFEGEEVSLAGFCAPGQGEVEISVDGGAPERVSLEGSGGFEPFWCASLDPGWHTVSIRASRLPARLDGARIRSEGIAAPICEAPPQGDPSCGCADSSSATVLLLPGWWIARLRRRPRGSRAC